MFSSFQFTRFAALVPSFTLVTLVTVAFYAVFSASIPGNAAVGATVTLSNDTSLRAPFPLADGARANIGSSGEPSISLIGANPLRAECIDVFEDPGATATNDSGQAVPVSVSGMVDTSNPGTYTLTYTAVDNQNSVSVERTVTVVDTTPPNIVLEGANPMTVICGEAFADPGASANDSCHGALPVTVSGVIDPNTQGQYTISYTSTDGSNNTKTVTRTVIVGSLEDNPPTLTLIGDAEMTIECGGSFTDPGATAITVCSGVVPVTALGIVDVRTAADYAVTYTASSGELRAEATRTVTVVDTIAPVVSLKGSNPLEVELHSIFTDPGATARDACAGEFAAAVSGTVDTNKTGSYTITYGATDPSGNEAVPVTRTVNVVDRAHPTAIGRLPLPNCFHAGYQLSSFVRPHRWFGGQSPLNF
jgi:hypothetical protein